MLALAYPDTLAPSGRSPFAGVFQRGVKPVREIDRRAGVSAREVGEGSGFRRVTARVKTAINAPRV